MKKLFALLLVMVMAFSFTGCTNGGSGGEDKFDYVGIAMPTQSSTRWISDGNTMKDLLESKGYRVDLQYAEDNIEAQVAQVENMVTKGVNVLVIAAIDNQSLNDVIQKAKDQGITVIAYDRLILGTEHVSYYATFDNFKVGVQQATYIVEKLDLANATGPFNIELFGGSPDDNNSYFFYDGAISVLKPYIDNGKLVVVSGEMGIDKVGTLRWDGSVAMARMQNLISAHYTDKNVDAVLSPYDGLSIGILAAVKAAGYGVAGKPLPIITGQDAELPSVKSIIAGEQSQTVFKDTRELAKKTVEMIEAVKNGTTVPINDTKTYDNGKKIVPSYLLEPVSVDINNYREALIDTGYWKESDLN